MRCQHRVEARKSKLINFTSSRATRRGGSCLTKLRLFACHAFTVAKTNRHTSRCARTGVETYRNAREIESEPTVRSNESFHVVLILEIRRIVGRSLSWSLAHVIRIHKAHAFKRKCDFELSRVVLSVARWVPVPSRCDAFARAFVIKINSPLPAGMRLV